MWVKIKLKILVNCYDIPLSREGSGGAGKFIQGLLPELAKKSEVYVICSKHNAEEYQFESIKKLFDITNFEEINILEICDGMDIYFNPGNKFNPIDFPVDIPVVTIIHDLQHNHYPHYFPNGGFESRNNDYGFAISRSDALVAISDWEKSNFKKYFDVNHIQTIYHSPYLFEKGRNQKNEKPVNIQNLTEFSNYYLYPAVAWPHKNHYRLIEAFHILNQKNKNFNLILTGSQHIESTSLLYKKIQELHAEDFCKVLGYVSDDELITLMSNAKGLVFPSLYEGFGIPIIDAMNFGIPVIASNLTSIPEITLNTINYFENSFDSYQIATDIMNFDEKINKGDYDTSKAIDVAKKYSKERNVSEYLNYFDSIIKSKNKNDPITASYSTKNLSTNKTSNKITIILDLESIESNKVEDFFKKISTSAKPEIFDYFFIMSYSFRENYRSSLDEMSKIAKMSYYQNKILVSKVLALEHLLESSIKTEYFICINGDQFENLDYSFLRKAESVLDYFTDIFSCYRSKEKYNILSMKRPSDEEASIREFNKTLNDTETILTRFYNRLIRTNSCRLDGMIGTVPALSKDTTTYSNIAL